MDLVDVEFPQPDKERLLRGLLSIVPKEAVLHRTEDTKPYECDGLAVYRNLPLAVVLPSTEQQVQAVLKLCGGLNVPVVARGAGTGLSGGALPHEQGIVLSLAEPDLGIWRCRGLAMSHPVPMRPIGVAALRI